MFLGVAVPHAAVGLTHGIRSLILSASACSALSLLVFNFYKELRGKN